MCDNSAMRGPAHFRLRDAGTQVAAGVREHSLAVTVDFNQVYTFDRAGRLLGYFDHGTYYRRSLDHRLLRKSRAKDGSWSVRTLDSDEASAQYEEMFRPLREIAQHLKKNRVVWTDTVEVPERRRQALAVFAQITAMDPSGLAADAERFRSVYTPVAILPPDQYLALVVQVTQGCSYNKCRFCHFYRDEPFRVKSASEFAGHIDEVEKFFGPGVSVRQSVFLADANALVAESGKLLPMLRLVNERFMQNTGSGAFRPKGIYSFVDSFHTQFEQPEIWSEYANLGVKRVYLGVESGCDELLERMDKPTNAESVTRAVTVLKDAGIDVGIILITGLGGADFSKRHVEASGQLLQKLPLNGRDIVYFSPYVETGSAEAMAEFGPPLSRAKCQKQQERIEAYLGKEASRPKCATYGLEEFVY